MSVYWFYLLSLCVLHFFKIYICTFLSFFCFSYFYSFLLYFYLRCLFHLTSTFTGPQGRAVSIIASYMVSPGAKSSLGDRLSWSEFFGCYPQILQHYGPDGPGTESRWGTRFSAPVQTGPGAHSASYTMGTGSFPGVKRPERGVDHPPPSSAKVEGGV